MFKKLATFFGALIVCFACYANSFAAQDILSIANISIAGKSDNVADANVSHEANDITTDVVLTRHGSFVTYEIELQNNAEEQYKIADVKDDISTNAIESSYGYGSDFIDSGKTDLLTAKYTYKTGQESDSDDPIALDDITITITLEDLNGELIEENNLIISDEPEVVESPLTADNLPFLILGLSFFIAAGIFLSKKHLRTSAVLVFLACFAFIGAMLNASTIAAAPKTTELRIHGISVLPKAAPHVVIFDSNSGLGDMEQQEFELDLPQKLNANAFRRNYYSFVEWNTEPDGSGHSYADEAEVNFSESGETTLYAQWSTDHAVAILDTGPTINRKIKQLGGANVNDSYGLFNVRLSGIYSVLKASELPAGFDTEDNNKIISSPESPFKVFAWIQGSTVYIYSDAEVIKGNRDMTETFVNFYNTGNFSGISDWDMSETEIFSSMFAVNNSLSTLNALANWDTSSATTLYRMFYRNFSLYTVEGLARWNTSKVTNLSLTFYWTRIASDYLSALSTTDRGDYTSWDVSNVTTMSYTFGGNESRYFTNLDGIANWNTSNVTNMSSMFGGSDYLENISAIATTQRDGYTSWDVSNVTNMSELFSGCDWLRSLHGIENWDVSNVTKFYRAFDDMTYLNDISALADWDISSATDISEIFDHAEKLTDISALAKWNTSNVELMNSAFAYAKSLSDISPISTWDTSSVTTLASMFSYTAITNTDALATTQRDCYTSWDVSNVESLRAIFAGDSNLTDISGIANWNTSSVTDLYGTFQYTAITNTDALATTQRDGYTSWDVSNVTDLSRTFYEITTLTNIDGIVNWDVSKVTYMDRTFNGDSGLTYVRMLDAWHPAENVRCTYVFHGTGTNNWPDWAD